MEILRHPIAIPDSRVRSIFYRRERRRWTAIPDRSKRVLYDKSFNIGRFHGRTYASASILSPPQSTFILTFLFFRKWSSLEAHTKPPYTLTLKSNGCIIFIAALSPSQLLITSKHSLGPAQGVPESHAQARERWLRRHLEQVGKTTEDLAKVL